MMDLRIGIARSASVIEIELPDGTDRAELRGQIDAAMDSGSGTLWITDKRDKEVGVPASQISFVELGSDETGRKIGFGA